jgi:hypothetical protein
MSILGLSIFVTLSLFEKALWILYISLLNKAFAEFPPFPPLKKGGRGGFKKAFQKAIFIPIF